MNNFKEDYYKELREDIFKSYREDVEYIEVKTKNNNEVIINEDSKDKDWIPKYKFLRDLRKNGTESNEIYRKWKKNR